MPVYKVTMQVRDVRIRTVVAETPMAAGAKAAKIVAQTGVDVTNYKAEEIVARADLGE